MDCIISFKIIYVYKYNEYIKKTLRNSYFSEIFNENSTIPIPFSPRIE